MDTKEGKGGEWNWETETDTYKLLCSLYTYKLLNIE